MIHIKLIGISLMLLVIISCRSANPGAQFSNVKNENIKNFNREFAEYCKIESDKNFETNAVVSNFFGDHAKSIEFATNQATRLQTSDNLVKIHKSDIAPFKEHFEKILQDPSSNYSEKTKAKNMLGLLEWDIGKIFRDKSPIKAHDIILQNASKYHFLLINEAHYSSQNRAFTSSLLKPLWNIGYRFLGLETLGHSDSLLVSRGYPTLNSGYYTRDPVFGNMIREALEIGYKIVPYETKVLNNTNTERDRDQATNIYNSTYRIDSIGKVIIHAGYSHIAEVGDDSYAPMGFQLKNLAGEDILTIDQVEMIELNDSSKLNPYYKYAIHNYIFNNPVIFVDKQNEPLIDAISQFSIDFQVYHPTTLYEMGRPTWLLENGAKAYGLPVKLMKYTGYLLQALKFGEIESAIPTDQIVIGGEKGLVLHPGKYILRLIDCDGSLIGTSKLKIN